MTTFAIADEAALRALFPAVSPLARAKSLDHLDAHARAFLARSPFLTLATQSAEGRADVSPRGDPAGFVRVLDDRTLAIPERPGNNRLDSLANILSNPAVGLLAFVPGYDETLRINGRAHLSRDPDLLAPMAIRGRAPVLAVVVEVQEVFLHCAKALRRSDLWNPAARQDRAQMPSLVQMILEQTTGPETPETIARLDAELEVEYDRTMY